MAHSIGIIGGGAAGMMAATAAKITNADASVTIFDKNPGLGAKVIISGGGRCNVTTGYTDIEYVLGKYPRGGKFLKNAMYAFGPADTYAWFENHGVRLKVEKDMRVFPRSNNGKDIVGVFEQFFSTHKVDVRCNTSIKSVLKADGGFVLTDIDGNTYKCDKLIITTGGVAYRQTGSTGDGYAFVESLGHSLTERGPSLNSFVIAEDFAKDLAGVSHTNVTMKATLKDGKKVHYSGPFIWTHKGISGPVVFAMSSYCAFEPCTHETPLKIYVDFAPGITLSDLEKHCFEFVKENPKKQFFTVFHGLAPKSVLQKIFTDAPRPCNEVSHANLRKGAESFKNYPLTAIGRGHGDEFVTAGGVDTSEVDPKTMESKVCDGLFLAGEILDVDGFTGGFNLQAAWCTGYLAGKNASSVFLAQ